MGGSPDIAAVDRKERDGLSPSKETGWPGLGDNKGVLVWNCTLSTAPARSSKYETNRDNNTRQSSCGPFCHPIGAKVEDPREVEVEEREPDLARMYSPCVVFFIFPLPFYFIPLFPIIPFFLSI